MPVLLIEVIFLPITFDPESLRFFMLGSFLIELVLVLLDVFKEKIAIVLAQMRFLSKT